MYPFWDSLAFLLLFWLAWCFLFVFYSNLINLLDCYSSILFALMLVYFLNSYWNLYIAFDSIFAFISWGLGRYSSFVLSNDHIFVFWIGVCVWLINNYYFETVNPLRFVELLLNFSIDFGGRNWLSLAVLVKFSFYIFIYPVSEGRSTKNALGVFYLDLATRKSWNLLNEQTDCLTYFLPRELLFPFYESKFSIF